MDPDPPLLDSVTMSDVDALADRLVLPCMDLCAVPTCPLCQLPRSECSCPCDTCLSLVQDSWPPCADCSSCAACCECSLPAADVLSVATGPRAGRVASLD